MTNHYRFDVIGLRILNWRDTGLRYIPEIIIPVVIYANHYRFDWLGLRILTWRDYRATLHPDKGLQG